MALLEEIVYDVREGIKEYSDDSEFSNEYIIYLYNIKRAKYLKQRLDRLGRKFDTRVLQTICICLEEVDANQCSIDAGCDKILRSKKQIPDLLQLSDKDAIERVGPSTKLSVKYNNISKEKATYYLKSNFANKIKSYLDDDGYLYLFSSQPIFTECISISGVFENPLDLVGYDRCGEENTSCFDEMKDDYPLTPDLIDIIRIEIINELLGRKDPRLEDRQNDSDDE
tara:strand:+ start:35060 stop:35737 length:678 start_codon:yes stop_codon:yes gene_type:complete